MSRNAAPTGPNVCFAIMPISDPEGYEVGHFQMVYEDLFIPAIRQAGFSEDRGDNYKGSDEIRATIINALISAPLAICDLSSRNPNVLYELGIRHAFDKPTLLVQEAGTPRIFDISGLRTIEYDRSLKYRSISRSRDEISAGLAEMANNSTSAKYSVLRLVQVEASELSNVNQGIDQNGMLAILSQEMGDLRRVVEQVARVEDTTSQQLLKQRQRGIASTEIDELRRISQEELISVESSLKEIDRTLQAETNSAGVLDLTRDAAVELYRKSVELRNRLELIPEEHLSQRLRERLYIRKMRTKRLAEVLLHLT